MSERVFNNNKTLDYSKKESIERLKLRIEKYVESMNADKETIVGIKESVETLNEEIISIGEKSREKVEEFRRNIGSYISRLQSSAVSPDFSEYFDKINSIDTSSFIEDNKEFLSSVVDNQMIFSDSHYDDLKDSTENLSSRKLQILHSKLFVNSWDNDEFFEMKYGFDEWEEYVKTLRRNKIKIPITSNIKTIEFGMVYRQKYDFTTENNDYVLERYYSGKIFFNNCNSQKNKKFEVRAIIMNGNNRVIKDQEEEIEPKITFKIYKDENFIYIIPYAIHPYRLVPLMTKQNGTFQTAPTIFDLKEYNLKAIKGIHRADGIYSNMGSGKHTIANPDDNVTDYVDKSMNKINLKNFIGINFDINFSLLDNTAFNDDIQIGVEEVNLGDINEKETVDFSIGAAPVGLIQLVGFEYNEGDLESVVNISPNIEKKTFENYSFKHNSEIEKPVHKRKPLERNIIDWTDTNLVGIPFVDRPGKSAQLGDVKTEFDDVYSQRLNVSFQSNTKFLEKYDPASGNGGSIKNFRVLMENPQYWFAVLESDSIVFQGSYYSAEGVFTRTSLELNSNHDVPMSSSNSNPTTKDSFNIYSYLGHYASVNNTYGDNASLNLIRSLNGNLFKNYDELSNAFVETELNKSIRIFDENGYEKLLISSNKGLFTTVNALDFDSYNLQGIDDLKNIAYPNFRNTPYKRIEYNNPQPDDDLESFGKRAYNYTHALIYEPKTGVIIFSKLKDLNCEIFKKKIIGGEAELIASLRSWGEDYTSQKIADANFLSIVNFSSYYKAYLAWIDEMNPQNVYPNYSKSMMVSTFFEEDPTPINESQVKNSTRSYHLYSRSSVNTPLILFLFNDITKSFDYTFMGRALVHDGMEWDGRNSFSSRTFRETSYAKPIPMASMISYGRKSKTLPAMLTKFLSTDILGSTVWGPNNERYVSGGSPIIKAMLPDKRGNLMYLIYNYHSSTKSNKTSDFSLNVVGNPNNPPIDWNVSLHAKPSLGATPSRFNSYYASGNLTNNNYGQNINASTGVGSGSLARFSQYLEGYTSRFLHIIHRLYIRGESFGTKIIFDGDYLGILDDMYTVNDDALISLSVDGRPDLSPLITLSTRYASNNEYCGMNNSYKEKGYSSAKSYDKYEHKFIKNKIYWDVNPNTYDKKLVSNFSVGTATNIRPSRTLRSAYDSIQFNMRRKNHMWNWSILVKINKNDYSISNVINPFIYFTNAHAGNFSLYNEYAINKGINAISPTLYKKIGSDATSTLNSSNAIFDNFQKFYLLNNTIFSNIKSIFRRTLYRSLSQRNLTDSDNRFRNIEQVINFGGILGRSEYMFYESGKIAQEEYKNDRSFITPLGNTVSNLSEIGIIANEVLDGNANANLASQNIVTESEYTDLPSTISESGSVFGGLAKWFKGNGVENTFKKHLFERSLDFYKIPRPTDDGSIVHSINNHLINNYRIMPQNLVDSTGITNKANFLDPASNIIGTMCKSIAGYKNTNTLSKTNVKIKNTIQFYSTTDTISWLGIKKTSSQNNGKNVITYSDILRVRVFNSKTGIGTSNEFIPMQYFTVIPNINESGKDLWFIETVDIENYSKNGTYIHYRLAPTLFKDNFGNLSENSDVFPFGTASDIWSNEWKIIKINENVSERDYPNFPRCSFILSSYYDEINQKLVCFLSSTKSYGFAETMKDKFNLYSFENMISWDKDDQTNAYVAMQNNQSPDYSTLVFDLRDLENLTFEVGKSKTWKAWSMFDNDSLQYEYDNMKRLIGEDIDGKYLVHPNSGIIYDLNDYLNIKPRKNQRMRTTQILYNNIRNSYVYITNTDDDSFNDERFRFKLPILKEVPQNIIEIKEKGFYKEVLDYLKKKYELNNGKDLMFQIKVKLRSDDTNLAGSTEKFEFTEIGTYNPYSRNNKIIRYVNKISSFDDYIENEFIDNRTAYLNDSLYTIKKLANRHELIKHKNIELFFGRKLFLKHTQRISNPLEGFDVENMINVPGVAEVIIYPTVAEFHNISYLIDRSGENFDESIENKTNNMLRGWINDEEIIHDKKIESDDEYMIDKSDPNSWKIEWKLSNMLAPKSISPISAYLYDMKINNSIDQAVIFNKKCILYNNNEDNYYERDLENGILVSKPINAEFEIEKLGKFVVSPQILKNSQILVASIDPIDKTNPLKRGFFVLYNDYQYKVLMEKYQIYEFDKENNLWVVFKDDDGEWYVKVYEIQYINRYIEFKETASYQLSDVPDITDEEKQDETVYLIMDDVQGDAIVIYPKLQKMFSIGFDSPSGNERRVISKEFQNPNYLNYKPFAARNSNEIYLIECGEACLVDPSTDVSWVNKENIKLVDPESLENGQEAEKIIEGYSKILEIKLYNHDDQYSFDTVDNEFVSIGNPQFDSVVEDNDKISIYRFPITLKKSGTIESLIISMIANNVKNSTGIDNKTIVRKLEFKLIIGTSENNGSFEVLSTNKEPLQKSDSKIKKIKFSDNVITSYQLHRNGLSIPTDSIYIKDAVVLRDNSLLVLVEKYYGYEYIKSKYLGQCLMLLDINKEDGIPSLIDLGKESLYSKKDSETFGNINNSLVGNIMYDMNSNELLLLPHKESEVFELHSFKVNYINK